MPRKKKLLGPRRKNTVDSRGTVEIKVTRRGEGSYPIKGNIVRSFTVQESTVSEVAERVREGLFE